MKTCLATTAVGVTILAMATSYILPKQSDAVRPPQYDVAVAP